MSEDNTVDRFVKDLGLEKRIRDIDLEIEKLYEKHHVSKEKADFINECDNIASVLNQFVVRLRKSKVHLLQEKTFEMYRLLSSRGGLIKDITIDDKTYEIKITDRNGHEIRKSTLSAGEKEVFAVSLLWGLAQTSELKLPIIIDTPLSRLDSTHRDNIVNNYLPNAGESVSSTKPTDRLPATPSCGSRPNPGRRIQRLHAIWAIPRTAD